MKRQLFPLAVGLAVMMGCSGDTGPSTPGPPPPPPAPPPANTVDVSSNQFTPTDLSTSRNTTVTWRFQGGSHNVTFEDNQGNSSDMSSGTHTRSFATSGTFRYRCTIHSNNFTSGMIGQVSVAN